MIISPFVLHTKGKMIERGGAYMTAKKIMKAYAVLFAAATALWIGVSWWHQAGGGREAVTVDATEIREVTVYDTVVCTGRVSAAEGLDVYASVPCVAGEVSVEVGDRVKAGDVLLTVDRSATLSMAVSAGLSDGQTAAVSASLPQTVTAPADGIVSVVNAARGDTLDTASPCVVLSEGDGVEIAVTLPERALKDVRVGQAVEVRGVAFEKEVYTGVVTDIASSARSRVNGTASETVVDAAVTLDEGQADDSLLIGLTAKATVTVAAREGVRCVPYDSIAERADGQCGVYRIEAGVATWTPVTLGNDTPHGAEVTSGLQTGDRVVSDATGWTEDSVAVTVNTEDAA